MALLEMHCKSNDLNWCCQVVTRHALTSTRIFLNTLEENVLTPWWGDF